MNQLAAYHSTNNIRCGISFLYSLGNARNVWTHPMEIMRDIVKILPYAYSIFLLLLLGRIYGSTQGALEKIGGVIVRNRTLHMQHKSRRWKRGQCDEFV